MYNSVATVKSFFSADHHVAHANQFANGRLYVVETRIGNKNHLVCTFIVTENDEFTINMAHSGRQHTGAGYVEFAEVLKAEGLLHPEQPV